MRDPPWDEAEWSVEELVGDFDNFAYSDHGYDAFLWNLKESYELWPTMTSHKAFYDFLNDGFLQATECRFCQHPFARFERLVPEPDAYHESTTEGIQRFLLLTCIHCGHWHLYHEHLYDWQLRPDELRLGLPEFAEGINHRPSKFEVYAGKLGDFDPSMPEGCEAEITQHLRRSPRLWHEIEPRALERLVESVFRANYGDAEVVHVGRPDDGGVDVILITSNDSRWLVQVKRRAPGRSEGVATIRNLLGAMVLHQECRGIVVSTADHFTYRAYEAVGRAREVGMTVELLSKRAFDALMDPLVATAEWQRLLAEVYQEPGAQALTQFVNGQRKLQWYREMIGKSPFDPRRPRHP